MKAGAAGVLVGILVLPMCTAMSSMAQTDTGQTLSSKQSMIAVIASFTAKGDMNRLKTAANEGLDAGLTINGIQEVLVQLYAYAGFPRSLNALNAFMAVVEERKQKGIRDAPGREANPLPPNKSRHELGTEIQTYLIGAPATGAVYAFAPAIDAFLKEHLFADVFGRDNLDFQSREIATISALSSMEGVSPQLASHVAVGLNVGLSAEQVRSLTAVLAAKVGATEGDRARDALDNVLKAKRQ